MADPLVELRDVRKSFEQKDVLRGVGFALPKGTTLAVMGGSGAGKTVLIRIAAGLLRPDAGQVSLFGVRIDRMREEAMLALRKRTGFVFQGAALFDSLSVFENVAYPLREHTRMPLGEITDRVHRFLSLVGMPGTDELLPAELSGGMRKRVGIARALVMEPEVVFFDEPTAGLDPTNARLVAELIATLRAGSTRVYLDRAADEVIEFATGPGFFKVELDRALALVDDAVNVKEIDDARAQGQLADAKAELARVEAGESKADRWQLEQRIKHAENQLAVSGRNTP